MVVATFDTGVNPFHPCWRQNATGSPRDDAPDLPPDARPLPLAIRDTFAESWEASNGTLSRIEDRVLYYVPGTRLLFYGDHGANQQLVDTQAHGALAATQIACDGFGFATNAYLLILNWYALSYSEASDMMEWVAAQSWVDIVHLNVQDTPIPTPILFGVDAAINTMVDAGKFVVVAAGNGVYGLGVNYPMEASRFSGPPGTLVAGANDQDGWILYSNLDPHVVMDGGSTRAGAANGFGSAGFNGTSSASPRITGYVAELLWRLRVLYDSPEGANGSTLLRLGDGRPSVGPLSDGILSTGELHEIVRKTADARLGLSRYDGKKDGFYVQQPAGLPFAWYPKVGYGKLTEATIEAAQAVTLGAAPMPSRPYEDMFYSASEAARQAYWKTV